MRMRLNSLALAALAVLLPLGAQQARAQSVEAEATLAPRLWLVELSGAPVADGGSAAALRSEKAAFRRAAAAAGIRYTERKAFDTLFNGFSVEVGPGDRAKLSQLAGVKAVWPVEVIQAPVLERSTNGSAPDLAAAIAMTGANIAQNSLGLTGAGVKVGVMDTGIDIDHPDFGGNGANGTTPFPTARIAYGHDFVGDAFNADPTSASYNPVAVEDGNPDDCGGHGSHVAGIVGANGTVKGVAPGVTFGAYRVFGCAGSTTADIMLAAMERALSDGMHVLNMSIGAAFQWPQYPTARAADRLVTKGMTVVTSIGNSGANGLYSASAPGVGSKVIGTASFDNMQVTQPAFTVQPGNLLVGYGAATGAPPPPKSGTTAISTVLSTSAAGAQGCVPADFAGFAAGHIALVQRGTCAFHIKAANAQAAGASGVVLYNNVAGTVTPTVVGVPAITIPVVSISLADGNMIAATAGATLTWGNQTVVAASPTGGLISSFSSFGLAPDLTFKPNIGAPGGNIYSTIPLELGAWGNNSGTSMASPHVAGGVALLLQASPKTRSTAVKTLLQNSADPKNWWGNPGLGFLDNTHRQGAGMLDIVGAIQATATVEPSELALGESQAGPATRTLTIENKGNAPVTYDLGHAPALSTGANTFTPTYSSAFAGVTFSAPSVVVPAKGSATVDVTITANATLAERGIYGGYVTLTPQGGGATMRVPYSGLKGDYQSFVVLAPTANGFPWLAKTTNGSTFSNNAAGVPYTMVGLDIPFFAIHLDHQARRVRLEAFDADTGKAWFRVSDDEYVGRNSTATGIFAFAWDGTTFTGKGQNGSQWYTAPNGRYVVKVSALKALGDENNPAHWETWTSPVITIARP
jgi:minor extracellular serine protease Vpr